MGWRASFPLIRVGGAPGLLEKYNSILYERINGNGKLTETENVIFYVNYGILTDERNSYVLLKQSMEIRLRMNGNVTLETTHKTGPKTEYRKGGPTRFS